LTYLRVAGTIFNELIVLFEICFTRLRDEGALSLVINFSAALIISQFDDILAEYGNIFKIKEHIKVIEHLQENLDAFFENSEPRFKSTNYLELNIKKNDRINSNGFYICLSKEKEKTCYLNLNFLH